MGIFGTAITAFAATNMARRDLNGMVKDDCMLCALSIGIEVKEKNVSFREKEGDEKMRRRAITGKEDKSHRHTYPR